MKFTLNAAIATFCAIFVGYSFYELFTPKPDLVFELPLAMTAEDQARVAQAANVFRERCPLIVANTDHIVSARVIVHRAPSGRGEDLGWRYQVDLRIVLNDDPDLPSRARRFRSWGHTLTYRVGFGGREGIDTVKPQEQAMCAGDVRIREGRNVLIEVPTSAG